MGYRIMRLKYVPLVENATVEQGIRLERPYHTLDIGYGKITSMYTPEYDLEVRTVYDYDVKEMGDGFKQICLHTPIIEDVKEEEAVMLIVPYAYVLKWSNGVKRIAGRYPTEGVFLLKPNDKIVVGKSERTKEEFAAVQFENKMYMIKVHDE